MPRRPGQPDRWHDEHASCTQSSETFYDCALYAKFVFAGSICDAKNGSFHLIQSISETVPRMCAFLIGRMFLCY